jgi:hypothetical protein
LLEIRKSKSAGDVMFVNYLPLGDLLMKRFEFFSRERGYATAAGYAGLAGKRSHWKISAGIVAVEGLECMAGSYF